MYEGEKNEILYGGDFVKDAKRLPRYIQEKLADLLAIAVVDIFDLRLHTKRLAPPLTGKYSFRITRDWRVTVLCSVPATCCGC